MSQPEIYAAAGPRATPPKGGWPKAPKPKPLLYRLGHSLWRFFTGRQLVTSDGKPVRGW